MKVSLYGRWRAFWDGPNGKKWQVIIWVAIIVAVYANRQRELVITQHKETMKAISALTSAVKVHLPEAPAK